MKKLLLALILPVLATSGAFAQKEEPVKHPPIHYPAPHPVHPPKPPHPVEVPKPHPVHPAHPPKPHPKPHPKHPKKHKHHPVR